MVPVFFLIYLVFKIKLVLTMYGACFASVKRLCGMFALMLVCTSTLFCPVRVIPTVIREVFALGPICSTVTYFERYVDCNILPAASALLCLTMFSLAALKVKMYLFGLCRGGLMLRV